MANVATNQWRQEWYETGDPTIRTRAAQLRRLGVTVRACNMGRQVTDTGSHRMTLLDIRRNGVDECVWDVVNGWADAACLGASHPRPRRETAEERMYRADV